MANLVFSALFGAFLVLAVITFFFHVPLAIAFLVVSLGSLGISEFMLDARTRVQANRPREEVHS